MVNIFIIYGGPEGKIYGTKIRSYFKDFNEKTFLASDDSEDIGLGTDYQSEIDYNLVNAEIVIVVVTSGLNSSIAAMSEIVQVLSQPTTMIIPFLRNGVSMPDELIHTQKVDFEASRLDDHLPKLELRLWRNWNLFGTRIPRSIENQSVELSYIG